MRLLQGCGSAFIWILGSVLRMRIQGYKIKDKSRVKPTIHLFLAVISTRMLSRLYRKLDFWFLRYLQGLGSDLKIKSIFDFWKLKDVLKFFWFYCPGSSQDRIRIDQMWWIRIRIEQIWWWIRIRIRSIRIHIPGFLYWSR